MNNNTLPVHYGIVSCDIVEEIYVPDKPEKMYRVIMILPSITDKKIKFTVKVDASRDLSDFKSKCEKFVESASKITASMPVEEAEKFVMKNFLRESERHRKLSSTR